VKDAHYGSLREQPMPMFYLPFAQAHTSRGQMTLHARTIGDPLRVTVAVRHEVQVVSEGAPMFEIQTLTAQVDASLVQERMVATLCGSFGTLALLLVSIGLYGVMAYSVARRTNEIGLRMALGAQASDVAWLVLRETMLLAGCNEEQCDHGEAEAEPGEGELWQQRDRAFTGAAQVAAHADDSVEGGVHEGAAVESMASQRVIGLALRAVVRAVSIRIGDFFGVALDGAGEWV
jgi:hypothetical protein